MGEPKRNYSKEMDALIQEISQTGRTPTLLLHACCAPCSSAVLENLSRYFSISLLYYNPNISPASEYEKRKKELSRLVGEMPLAHPVTLLPCDHRERDFLEIARGLEDVPEGGERCMNCFRLRLREAAKTARDLGFDYFTTTLSISPLKNVQALNRIGEEAGAEFGVAHLPSDFKKKDGYKRSIQLSREYGLYRQDYCGCAYSKAEREKKKEGSDRFVSAS